MFDLDNWYEILYTLAKNPIRTVLTAFGVFWGIFLLIAMMAGGNGLENGVRSDFQDVALNSVFVWGQRTSMPYKGMSRGRPVNFENGDIEILKERVEHIGVIAPRNQLGGFRQGNNVTRGVKSGAFNVMGDYPEIQYVQTFKVEQGRFLNPFDLKENRKVCVIGRRVGDVLFDEGEERVGDYIKIQGVYFQVVGVFKALSGNERDEETIYIPFTTFQNAFNYGNQVSWFALMPKEGKSAAKLETDVKQVLMARHKVHPDDIRALGSWNVEENFGRIQGLFLAIKSIVWIVGIGTLFAGIIGVTNIMLIVIKERTKEIGVRRALGATPFVVIRQIMMEAITLTALAGVIGLLMSLVGVEALAGILEGAESSNFQNPEVSLNVAISALVILVFAGAIAGLLPAYRAVSVSPVDALRNE